MATCSQTVREIAIQNPASTRVFEKLGIDFCCGGRRPLTEACADKNLSVEEVIAAIQKADHKSANSAEDWSSKPLAALIPHIVNTHHAYINQEAPRLAELAKKVVGAHGATSPEVLTIQQKFAELAAELNQHCAKEEIVLFPYIAKYELALTTGSPKPHGCFGSVTNPIAMMVEEHDAAGALIAEIRTLSHDFAPPPSACPTFHALYQGLHEFEQDLHQHIHLENNILFPRAIEMEK